MVKEVFRYRYNSSDTQKTLTESRKKREARALEEEGGDQPTKKTKKLREVYLVTKNKFYSEATSEEFEMVLNPNELDDNSHRIIQAKVL